MALTLDASVGGISSNAYLTRVEGDSYHESRLFIADWTGASNDDKEAAIVWASRLLDDGMRWEGSATDVSTPQALSWPRFGIVDKDFRNIDSDVIPEPIKQATAELARLLIVEDRAADPDTIGFNSIAVGPLKIDIDKLDKISPIPDSVYDLIRDFGIRHRVQGGMMQQVELIRV